MAVFVVGLLYFAALVAVLAYAAAGIWAIGLAILSAVLYVLVREWPARRPVNDTNRHVGAIQKRPGRDTDRQGNALAPS